VPLTEFEKLVKLTRESIDEMGTLVSAETKKRQVGNIIGAVLLILVVSLGIDNRATAHQAQAAANTANNNATALARKAHADAVSRCEQTNIGREGLRQLADGLTSNIAGILTLANRPDPSASSAQRQAATEFFRTAQDSITATRTQAESRFPNLDCTKVSP
jgi:hypothetical protein